MTTSWTNLAGGDWTVGSDWSTLAVPTSSDIATINNAGTYTVTLTTANAAASSLTIGDATATLALSGSANLTVGGVLTNDGTITVTAGTLTAGTFTQNFGTTTIGGTLSSPTVSILGGTFSDTGAFTNTGTITASNATATFGNLSNDVTNKLTGGTYRVLGGGTLNLQSGITTLDATLTLNSATAVANTGTSTIASSLTTIGAGGTLNVLGGNTFAGAGTVTVVGTGTGTSAALVDVFTGSKLTENSITVSLDGTVINAGTIVSNVTVNPNGTLTLASGSTLTGTVAGTTGTLNLIAGTGPGSVTLAGTSQTGGTLGGFGTVAVSSGTWTVNSASNALPATMTGDGGGSTLTFTGAAGTIGLGGVKNFNTINLANGTNTVTLTDNTLSGTGGAVTINGGTGPDSVTVNAATSAGKTLTFVAGASTGDSFSGGNENDVVKGTGGAKGLTTDTLSGGAGNNTITLTGAGAVDLSNASGFQTINLFGGNALTIGDNELSTNNVTVNGSTAVAVHDTVTSSATVASAAKTLTYLMGASTTANKFVGGGEIDIVRGAATAVTGDTLTGGSQPTKNTLTLTTGGTADLSNVSKFDSITLAGNVTNTVTISSVTLAGTNDVTPVGVTIHDANSGTTLVQQAGTAGTAGQELIFLAGTGVDNFTGGAEGDIVQVSAAAVKADTLNGGSGDANTLTMTTAGTFSLGGVTNFRTINLAGGTNVVTGVAGAFQATALTINGGGATNTITVGSATGNTLTYNQQSGAQTTFTNGGEIDIFNVSAANATADALNASSVPKASNLLTVTTAGTFNLTKDHNFGQIKLTAGTNVVTALGSDVNSATVTTTGTATTNNTLNIVSSGTATAIGAVDLTNVGKISTINLGAATPVSGFNATVSVGNTTLAGNGNGTLTINDAATGSANSVSAAGATTGTLTYVATIKGDSFQGGTSENDVVKVNPNQLGGAGFDTLTGSSGGSNTLILTAAGSLNLPIAQVNNFGTIDLAAGSSAVTVGSTGFVGTPGSALLTIADGASGNNVVQGGASSAGDTLTYNAGTGFDYFQGGSENDVVNVAAGNIGGDILVGGSGTSTLNLTTAGGFSLGGVRNFSQINLHTGNNTVSVNPGTLFGTLSGGTVTIAGGNAITGTNVINGQGAAGESLIYLEDHKAATFNAGAEKDTFTFTDVTANLSTGGVQTITGFNSSAGNDILAFKTTGANPFVNSGLTTTAFDSTHDYFYNTSNGQLLYSTNSGVSSTEIAVLTNHAALSSLTFVP